MPSPRLQSSPISVPAPQASIPAIFRAIYVALGPDIRAIYVVLGADIPPENVVAALTLSSQNAIILRDT